MQLLIVSADPERIRQLEGPLRAAGHDVASQTDPAVVGTDLLEPNLDAAIVDLSLPALERANVARALSPNASAVPPEPLEEIERRHIQSTLQYTGGNKRRAAQMLGIARSTLIQKVRRYGIEVPGRGRG